MGFLQRERFLIISHCRFMYQQSWIPDCRGERAGRKGIAGETARSQLIGTKQKDRHYVRYTPLIQMFHDQAVAFRPMIHINSVKTLQPE